MTRFLCAVFLSIVCASGCLAQARDPQSLKCAEQLAELGKQYSTECAPKFGRPPSCDACPSGSASCVAKCNECKIIHREIVKLEQKCGT
jgi:hypothetical protein